MDADAVVFRVIRAALPRREPARLLDRYKNGKPKKAWHTGPTVLDAWLASRRGK